MYGHEGVSRDLKRRIEQRLPVRLATMRAQKGVGLEQIPNPAQVLPYFLPYVDIGHYPTVCVTELDTPTGMSGAREVKQGTRFDTYRYRYPFRIWVYVMSVDYGITELMLKRYLTALREVILENRILTDTDDAHVTFDPETLSENFDSPMEDDARQMLGAGFIGVILESTEVINLSTYDPRSDLPLDVQGGVYVRDLHTDLPTGVPSEIPEQP